MSLVNSALNLTSCCSQGRPVFRVTQGILLHMVGIFYLFLSLYRVEPLNQWFLTGAILLTGDTGNVQTYFSLLRLGGYHWHLIERVQGYGQTSLLHRTVPYDKTLSGPDVNSAKFEKPISRCIRLQWFELLKIITLLIDISMDNKTYLFSEMYMPNMQSLN